MLLSEFISAQTRQQTFFLVRHSFETTQRYLSKADLVSFASQFPNKKRIKKQTNNTSHNEELMSSRSPTGPQIYLTGLLF